MLSAARRSLSLRREVLAALPSDALSEIAGAAPLATIPALCFVYDPTRLRCVVSDATCLEAR
jgi:hypothetical protein